MTDGVTILVADDERAIREGCRRVLTGKGYKVLEAENGRTAMEILSKDPVDILLLDLKMPVMGGEEVLEMVNKHHAHIPVIIITGHGTVDTAVACMKKGAYDFITKPFQIDPFLLIIGRAAEKKRLEEKARIFEEESARNLYDLGLEKSRLRTIINCMGNGVMVTNRNLEMVLHNPALARLLEISLKVENPVPLKEVFTEGPLIRTLENITSGESGEKEAVIQEISAGKNVLRAVSAPLIGPEGQVAGTVTVLENISAFKQLDRMKSDFVNMVAHELRSPLVSMRQLNSVLLDGLAGALGDKQRDFIGRGTKKIDNLLELINDLLGVAKIEAGRFIQRMVPTDIARILEETVALLKARAEKQGIELALTCENLSPLQADPKSMDEIFGNLISNAVNYSPEGGKVSIIARGLGEYVEISVEDTGVGIATEEIPKIFDKFYRVKHPKTRQVVGTGLGLAIVKGAVEAHQGSIDVKSVLGKGTTFRILLPVVKESVHQ
ncbi:MAG: response regulator [Deltaproteobacteria bacterium]|nr:response regulator [Deltaproteobacteria bacterium]